jgi:hypothetical protein
MSEQTFVLVHCFYKVTEEFKASFNSIAMATVIILSFNTQNPRTANVQHIMAVVIPIFKYCYISESDNPLTTANNDQPTLFICLLYR